MRSVACQPCGPGKMPWATCLPCSERKLQRKSNVSRVRSAAKRLRAFSKTPALRVAHEKIAEGLNACHRFELFRIDEERIERRAFLFAEQLHQADILLDEIVRQQCDAEPALAGAQQSHDVVDDEARRAGAFAVAICLDQPVAVLQ